MPFKVQVIHTAAPTPQEETFIFLEDRATIGRDDTSDITLTDPKRLVSKRHAEITLTDSGFKLTDQGSKNFTYLNGERLKAGQAYPFFPGDAIRIGDFELSVEVHEEKPAPPPPPPIEDDAFDRTVIDFSFGVNPFEEEVGVLVEQLQKIAALYDQENPIRREDALLDALRKTLIRHDSHKVHFAIGEILNPHGISASTTPVAAAPPPPPPPPPPAPPASPPSFDRTAVLPSPPPPPSFTPVAPLASATSSRLEKVTDTALRSIAKLVGIPWQFRHEFIGQTILQREDTAFLYGELEALRAHLFNPSLPEDLVNERLQLLEDAADELALHQVALLDGYKSSVQQGGERLLDQISPEAIQETVTSESALYRFIPPLGKLEVLRRLEIQLGEIKAEDWSSLERRTYRPAFVKAYLARMTARRQAPSPPTQTDRY